MTEPERAAAPPTRDRFFRTMDWLMDHPGWTISLLAATLISVAIGGAIVSSWWSDAHCAEMCEAVDSRMAVRTEFGCLCENDRHFATRGSR